MLLTNLALQPTLRSTCVIVLLNSAFCSLNKSRCSVRDSSLQRGAQHSVWMTPQQGWALLPGSSLLRTPLWTLVLRTNMDRVQCCKKYCSGGLWHNTSSISDVWKWRITYDITWVPETYHMWARLVCSRKFALRSEPSLITVRGKRFWWSPKGKSVNQHLGISPRFNLSLEIKNIMKFRNYLKTTAFQPAKHRF